jgi:hypothetical protein
MTEEEKKNILYQKIIAVFDTHHDFNDKNRCEIGGEIMDVLENYIIHLGITDTDPEALATIQPWLQRAKAEKQIIAYLDSKLKDQHRMHEDIFKLPENSDTIIPINDFKRIFGIEPDEPSTTRFMIDCAMSATFNDMLKNEQFFKDYFIDTIATYWDQSNTKPAQFVQIGDKYIDIETSIPANICFNDKSVVLNGRVEFPRNMLKGRIFTPSVRSLCGLMSSMHSLNDLDVDVVRSELFRPISCKKKKGVTVKEDDVHTVAECLTKALKISGTIENAKCILMNIKQSGDDSQILSVKALNLNKNGNGMVYLITCDQLCYYKCKLYGVNAVYLDMNNNMKVFSKTTSFGRLTMKADNVFKKFKIEFENIPVDFNHKEILDSFNRQERQDRQDIELGSLQSFVDKAVVFLLNLKKSNHDLFGFLTERYILNNIEHDLWVKLKEEKYYDIIKSGIGDSSDETLNQIIFILDVIGNDYGALAINDMIRKDALTDSKHQIYKAWKMLGESYILHSEKISGIFNSLQDKQTYSICKEYLQSVQEFQKDFREEKEDDDYGVENLKNYIDKVVDAMYVTNIFNFKVERTTKQYRLCGFTVPSFDFIEKSILTFKLQDHPNASKAHLNQNANTTISEIFKRLYADIKPRAPHKTVVQLIVDVIHAKSKAYANVVNEVEACIEKIEEVLLKEKLLKENLLKEKLLKENRKRRADDEPGVREPGGRARWEIPNPTNLAKMHGASPAVALPLPPQFGTFDIPRAKSGHHVSVSAEGMSEVGTLVNINSEKLKHDDSTIDEIQTIYDWDDFVCELLIPFEMQSLEYRQELHINLNTILNESFANINQVLLSYQTSKNRHDMVTSIVTELIYILTFLGGKKVEAKAITNSPILSPINYLSSFYMVSLAKLLYENIDDIDDIKNQNILNVLTSNKDLIFSMAPTDDKFAQYFREISDFLLLPPKEGGEPKRQRNTGLFRVLLQHAHNNYYKMNPLIHKRLVYLNLKRIIRRHTDK